MCALPTQPATCPPRHLRARRTLVALSVGDAFGEQLLTRSANPLAMFTMLEHRQPPPAPWRWTDDTAMAISLLRTLEARGEVDQDMLASLFAEAHHEEPWRGYGGGARRLLRAIHEGAPWRETAAGLFSGGSYGNGGAMRAAPLGVFFADHAATHEDTLAHVASQARLSAEVTHAHREGQAGAIAIAVAAASMWRTRSEDAETAAAQLFNDVLAYTPPGLTRDGLEHARALPPETHTARAGDALGNGSLVSAQDTAPLCVWLAARHADDMHEALWETAMALGDIDTTCAIVAGVLAGRRGLADLPDAWRAATEAIPEDLQPPA